MKEFTVNLKPLTPLWTGDANRECNDLKESGIIGSLRWWYEALLRGLGFNACDPTNESSRCKLDQKKFYEAINSGKSVLEALNEQNICPACQLFGCSGWARKFRLEINHEVESLMTLKINNKIVGLMPKEDITFKFIELKDITEEEYFLLNKTLEIIDIYGALGARISQGYGVIKITKNDLPNNFANKLSNHDISSIPKTSSVDNNDLPNIKNFHFYKFVIEFNEKITSLIDKKVFRIDKKTLKMWGTNNNLKKLWENYDFLPIASNIRRTIRRLEDNGGETHAIFGESGKGSKVFVSHGYKINEKTVEFRIWGYGIDSSLLFSIQNNLESNLKQKLFSGGEDLLKNCLLKEEKTGESLINQLVEELI